MILGQLCGKCLMRLGGMSYESLLANHCLDTNSHTVHYGAESFKEVICSYVHGARPHDV